MANEIHLLHIRFEGGGDRVIGVFADKQRAVRECEALNDKQTGWAGVSYCVETLPVISGEAPFNPGRHG